MKKVQYADFLDDLRLRERREQTTKPLLEGATLPRKREASKETGIRLSPEMHAFLKRAAKATNTRKVDESTIVAAGLALLRELDIPWEAVSSRDELIDAVRRRLRSHEIAHR